MNNELISEKVEKLIELIDIATGLAILSGKQKVSFYLNDLEKITKYLTNIPTLTQERDELKYLVADMSIIRQKVDTQLELEQSKVARCVEEIKSYRDVEEHGLMIDSMNEFLSSLPTTQNLVQQVKELSEELSDAKHSFELHFLAGYEAGYENGGNDCAEHNSGVASKHYSIKEREKKNAWKDYKETLNHEQNKGG
jgi:hypothetical protein